MVSTASCLITRLPLGLPVIRDFLDGFRPTTTVGLSDDSIADPKIGNHFSCLTAAVAPNPLLSGYIM